MAGIESVRCITCAGIDFPFIKTRRGKTLLSLHLRGMFEEDKWELITIRLEL